MDAESKKNRSCVLTQIVSFDYPVNDLESIEIFDDCGCAYSFDDIQVSYSVDGICWSCWMTYKEALINTIELTQDFYVKFKVNGPISSIKINGVAVTGYSTQLDSEFKLSGSSDANSNTFNPYANMEGASTLYEQLSEAVSTIVGIPCYYIKLNPHAGSRDMTFKEYALYGVDSIKQLKIVIQNNEMPSSKPEFTDFGLDWQTDWEVEVTKESFATAFGIEAQPLENDLIYIPMMKRMWMVNYAYEEKKTGFMWNSSTFKLALVKYQEKDSVDLGDTQTFVDAIVKTKYEDLFGEDDNSTLASNEDATEAPLYAANRLYNIYESDAVRKYMTCDSINISANSVYYKGALIADSKYEFLYPSMKSRIVYQKKYCGENLSMSFIINALMTPKFEDAFISIGTLKVKILQEGSNVSIYINKNKTLKISISTNTVFFIVIRWSRDMNLFDMHAYKYTYNQNIPLYKVSNGHRYFDIDNPVSEHKARYDTGLSVDTRSDVEIGNIWGWLTNFKLFDVYVDDLSDLLQMYPNHQHLLINDTARKLVDLPGVKPA